MMTAARSFAWRSIISTARSVSLNGVTKTVSPVYHDNPAEVKVLRRMRRQVGLNDRALLGRFYASLGHCQWFFGQFDQAIETHMRGVGLCEFGEDWEGAAHHSMVDVG